MKYAHYDWSGHKESAAWLIAKNHTPGDGELVEVWVQQSMGLVRAPDHAMYCDGIWKRISDHKNIEGVTHWRRFDPPAGQPRKMKEAWEDATWEERISACRIIGYLYAVACPPTELMEDYGKAKPYELQRLLDMAAIEEFHLNLHTEATYWIGDYRTLGPEELQWAHSKEMHFIVALYILKTVNPESERHIWLAEDILERAKSTGVFRWAARYAEKILRDEDAYDENATYHVDSSGDEG